MYIVIDIILVTVLTAPLESSSGKSGEDEGELCELFPMSLI